MNRMQIPPSRRRLPTPAAVKAAIPVVIVALMRCPALPFAGQSHNTARGRSAISRGASSKKEPHSSNVEGNFYVDHTCIDCDTCRWMAPQIFGRTASSGAGQSYVYAQPSATGDIDASIQAMIACPTGSIRTHRPEQRTKEVLSTFPLAVDKERLPQVFHLGYHSKKSFGATSYFIASSREDGSRFNIMFDSPRYSSKLADILEQAGGVHLMVLSHMDDVADHNRWKERFPDMHRVMHEADVRGPSSWPYIDMTGIEEQLSGEGPWALAHGLKVVHTPGHSKGSITLLASGAVTGGDGVAFTGDHLALNGRLGRLDGFARYSDDTALQSESMRKLADEDILWILPGHGRRMVFSDEASRKQQLLQAAEEYKQDPQGREAPGPLFQVLNELQASGL